MALINIKITSGMLEAPIFAIIVSIIFFFHPVWHVACFPLLVLAGFYFVISFYGQMVRDNINGYLYVESRKR